MQKSYHLPVRYLLFIAAIFFSARASLAQSVYLPYSYQFDQKFDADIYSVKNSFHTALKPYLIDSILSPRYNRLMQLGVDSSYKSWALRKLFNEHLFDVKTKEYTFYGDYLPDLQIGRELKDQKTTFLNTRGYQLGGTVGDKFSFYTTGYENQGVFPAYYDAVVNSYHFVPGQSYDRSFGKKTKDWSYATAIVSYTPIKQLNVTLGADKTFIGDGYRSLLLSDYAAPYPLLRVTANLGKVQYMAMWTYMESLYAQKFDGFGSNRRKWGMFHYLDWNVTNRLSLGVFNALIAAEADDNGNLHGFDVNYINPVLLLGSLGPSKPIPDNTFGGFTAKYKIFDKSAVYGQFLLDNYINSSGSNAHTYGYQLGIRGADIFKVNSLNYILEYNTVKPYAYASSQPITSYTQYEEPLGDPLGANFTEAIGILNYSIGKFDLQGQFNYAKYEVSSLGQNNGMSLAPALIPPVYVYGLLPATIPVAGQGIATNLYYAEGTASYLVNPKYNLRIELGALYRNETNSLGNTKTVLFTFGLRSTFRGLYHDF
jgi:hypothetical protein